MKLIFIGPQGSGKGTQAEIISEELGIPHISTGDLFREAEGEVKGQVDLYMQSGKLVPDELTLKILKQRISQPDCKKGFILDGFPRNINQVNLLKTITEIDKVIEITLSDFEALKRLEGRVSCEKCKEGYNLFTEPKPKNPLHCDLCGGRLVRRDDDNEQAIKKRLEIYHKETEPILNEYKDILIKINGEQNIEKITQDILKALR
ncbi:MAG: nucleoside monophosphate kinase [Candidatus Nanoarchaeia archaeon]|nr:nucleoside monophosphate kinase [Candidatus Nanoarchaeia archaeon]